MNTEKGPAEGEPEDTYEGIPADRFESDGYPSTPVSPEDVAATMERLGLRKPAPLRR